MEIDNLVPINADTSARLINAAGSEAFGDILMDAARAIGGVEELFGYTTDQNNIPQKLFSCSSVSGSEERVARYSARFFRHDPALQTSTDKIGRGGFCRRVRPNEIMTYDYRQLCYDRPNFAEKISFGWRDDKGLLMINFYRSHYIDDPAALKLARLADVAIGAMKRAQTPVSDEDLIEKLEHRLKQSRPELTGRERQVSTRLIAGWSLQRIADQLEIGIASVITYRRRSLHRYGLSSISAFLSELIY